MLVAGEMAGSWRRESDRDYPLGTVLDRPIWHASGTDLATNGELPADAGAEAYMS